MCRDIYTPPFISGHMMFWCLNVVLVAYVSEIIHSTEEHEQASVEYC